MGKSDPTEDEIENSKLLPVNIGVEVYHHESEHEQRVCRNCHDDAGNDFIVPCLCSGSIRWVHRSCLDQWRAASPNPDSFLRCDVCLDAYRLVEEKDDEDACVGWKIALRVSCDLLVLALIWQIIVWICVAFTLLVDPSNSRAELFPVTWSKIHVDYVTGLGAFFFFLGVYSVIYSACKFCCDCCSEQTYTYSTYPYSTPNFCFFYCPQPLYYYPSHYHHHHNTSCCMGCNGCNSGGGGSCGGGGGGNCGGGGKDCGEAALIIVVIFIVIGLIVALGIGIYIFVKSLKLHTEVLKKKHKAGQLVVADRSHEIV